MAYIPVLDTVQAELILLVDGQRCENVFHFHTSTPFTVTDMDLLATDLIAFWDAQFKTQYNSTVFLSEVKITDMSAQNAPSVTSGAGLPIAGTRTGVQLPNNCAVVFTKRTALRGRSYRGRVYFGPLGEPDVVNNAATPALVTGLLSRYETMKTRVIGARTWNMAVVSRFQNGNPLAFGVATNVSGFTSDGVIDSQRRRLPGRGS